MIDKNKKFEKVIYVSSKERKRNTEKPRKLSSTRDKYKTKGD